MLDERGARMVDNPNNEIRGTIHIFVKDTGLVTDTARQRLSHAAGLRRRASSTWPAAAPDSAGADDSSLIQIFPPTSPPAERPDPSSEA